MADPMETSPWSSLEGRGPIFACLRSSTVPGSLDCLRQTCRKMGYRSKIKSTVLTLASLAVMFSAVLLYIEHSSTRDLLRPTLGNSLIVGQELNFRKLWGSVLSLEILWPHANPRSGYTVPSKTNNGYIYAKVYGGFEKIRSSICDLVTISRLLNATLVIPELQDSTRSKGISSKFRSFSYLYDEEQFITALADDVIVVKSLPDDLMEDRKKNKLPLVQPDHSASPGFYMNEVLPKLTEAKAVGFLISTGGCLQSILPPAMVEYQRLRCRVAFYALRFRSEIEALGRVTIKRLRASGPYLAFHPGLTREALAFNGCGELFQDLHTELIQYTRAQMIKRGRIHEQLTVNSVTRRRNGSCPPMPAEVGKLLQAVGYPPDTIIYLAGSETFGGQRILSPLRAMYNNLVDRTTSCSKTELSRLIGAESPIPSNVSSPPPAKSEEELIKERTLPPSPTRRIHPREKEGWYGWITETNKEPSPTPLELREKAHRLLWDALDYLVSVEADAFFPGFNNDGSNRPDFSSLVMGHRLYRMPSSITYRPDRKFLAGLYNNTNRRLFQRKHNWTDSARDRLQKSLGVEGLIRESQVSKPALFLSQPLPECFCSTRSHGSPHQDKCPERMKHDIGPAYTDAAGAEDGNAVEEMDILWGSGGHGN